MMRAIVTALRRSATIAGLQANKMEVHYIVAGGLLVEDCGAIVSLRVFAERDSGRFRIHGDGCAREWSSTRRTASASGRAVDVQEGTDIALPTESLGQQRSCPRDDTGAHALMGVIIACAPDAKPNLHECVRPRASLRRLDDKVSGRRQSTARMPTPEATKEAP
jgi:hypothetical protein